MTPAAIDQPRKLPRVTAYGEDLAFIHDDGFGMIARGAAETLLQTMRTAGPRDGLVVELACGSGISSRLIADAGYDVLGFDLSPAMIEMAAARVPEGRFEVCSLYDAAIPSCAAVTAIGEAFNYMFDERTGFESMSAVFARAFAALRPGGLLIFDVAHPGRGHPRMEQTSWTGAGWRVTSQVIEAPTGDRLRRKIVSHREIAGEERRREESHELALYGHEAVFAALREAGFIPRTLASYGGQYLFSAGHGGFLARKPLNAES